MLGATSRLASAAGHPAGASTNLGLLSGNQGGAAVHLMLGAPAVDLLAREPAGSV